MTPRGRNSNSANNDFNWSNYHDKQLKLFESLTTSLNSTNKLNTDLTKGLTAILSSLQSIATSLKSGANSQSSAANRGPSFFVNGVDVIAEKSRKLADEMERNTRAQIANIEQTLLRNQAEREATEATLNRMKIEKELQEEEERLRREEQEAEEELRQKEKEAREKAKDDVEKAGKELLKIMNTLGEHANKYSDISNQLLQQSGMGKETVQSFRSEFIREVMDLNNRTGNAYNAQKSYQDIVNMTKGVTSSLEAIDEMATPLLLAQESLNVDTHQVATLLNKLYIRYSFSSSNMESLLDTIKGNTAGNSANEEATLENISKLESLMQLSVKDNKAREEYMSTISTITSHAESLGIDSSEITGMIASIADGSYKDNPLLLNILNQGGLNSSATSRLQSGSPEALEEVYEALLTGVTNITETHKGNFSRREAIEKNTGISLESAANIYSAVTADTFESLDEFKKTADKQLSMAENVDAKYVSFQDRLLNELSGITSVLSDLQEDLGVGLTDIAWGITTAIGAYTMFKNITGGVRGLGNGGLGSNLFGGRGGTGNIFGGGTASAGGSSTALVPEGYIDPDNLLRAGKLARLKTGLGGATLVAAGGTAAVDGAIDTYQSYKDGDMTGANWSGLQTVAGGTAAAAGGAMIAGAVTGTAVAASVPVVGWAALAIAGVAALGKAAHENAIALTGNAAQVEKDMKSLGDSLQDENRQRIRDLSKLNYQFQQENDLENQRRLLIEAGLATEEELQGKNEEQLQSLIDSYMSAAKKMNSITEATLKSSEDYYTEQQHEQQKQFIKDLAGVTSSSDREHILDMLIADTTDEDLKKKLKKKKKGGVSDAEWDDILDGGANAWFDQNNLTDKSIAVETMMAIDGLMNFGRTYTTTENSDEVSKLMNDFKHAVSIGDQSKLDAAYEAIRDSGLEKELRDNEENDNYLQIWGYSKGTNYVPADGPYYLHEGEAVVPKKYNPAADGRLSSEEISSMSNKRDAEDQYKTRQLMSLVDELIEIKEFLKSWQLDNNQREKMTEIKNKNLAARTYVSTYRKM